MNVHQSRSSTAWAGDKQIYEKMNIKESKSECCTTLLNVAKIYFCIYCL